MVRRSQREAGAIRRPRPWHCHVGNNISQEGIGGVSVGADLLVAKGIDESGTGTDDGIAEAVDCALPAGQM